MCKSTLEFTVESMFRTELFEKVTGVSAKEPSDPFNNSEHADGHLELPGKGKVDTDHSSNNSKEHSAVNSPERDTPSGVQIQILNGETDKYSHILWQFISERYAPYLELLTQVQMSPNQYGPIIRICLEKYFSELLRMEAKEVIKYCGAQQLNKVSLLVFVFGLKTIALFSRGIVSKHQSPKIAYAKEMEKLAAFKR